jgi:hypothetical protein
MKKSTFALALLLTLPLSSQAQDKITIQSNTTITYSLSEINSVVVRADSAIFNLKSGGRYAAPSLGMKWTFGGIVASNPQEKQALPLNWQIRDGQIWAQSSKALQFELLSLDGKVLASSQGLSTEWNAVLLINSPSILRVRSEKLQQSYLIHVEQK